MGAGLREELGWIGTNPFLALRPLIASVGHQRADEESGTANEAEVDGEEKRHV